MLEKISTQETAVAARTFKITPQELRIVADRLEHCHSLGKEKVLYPLADGIYIIYEKEIKNVD